MGFFVFDKRVSIAAKFNFFTIAVIIATAAGICLFMIRLEKETYYNELLNHGKTIADTTAKNCELGVFTENQAALLPLLESLSADSEVAYVSVLTRRRVQLATRIFKGTGWPAEQPLPPDAPLNDVTYRELSDRSGEERYIEVVHPVLSGETSDINDLLFKGGPARAHRAVIGYLRLGLTQEGLRKRLHQLVLSATAFTSVLVLIGSVITVLWSRRITSPLKRLTAATQDMAEGKFDSPIRIRTTDEIFELAKAFDHMRERLRAYRIEVEQRIATEQRHLLEKEQILMDLHDGIGGITTNISILSEVAQQAKDLESVKRQLAIISQLSREGSSEIRSFMQSLDSKELSWQTLAAHLRNQGTTMVEPHRIRFSAITSVGEVREQPGSLLWVNVFRIYKEALTNVIKHSRAESVAVTLVVTEAGLVLTVEDDGIGWEETVSEGRGFQNMRKRARETGGMVSITASGKGSCIRLEIPLPLRLPEPGT